MTIANNRFLVVIFLVCSKLVSTGQTLNDCIPVAGDNFKNGGTSSYTINHTPSGVNQVWNYIDANLLVSSNDTFKIVQSSVQTQYPMAEIMIANGTIGKRYYRISTGSLELSLVSSGGTYDFLNYSDPQTFAPMPISLGGTVTDTWSYTTQVTPTLS